MEIAPSRTMSELLADIRSDHDRVSVPTIWVALFISMLLHALVLWEWLPRLYQLSLDISKEEAASSRLQVQLVPRAAPRPAPPPTLPAAPALRPQPPEPKKAPSPKAVPRKPPAPPALALNRPGPEKAPPAPAPSPPESKPAPPVEGDLSSYIAARRRARGETAPSAPSEPAPPAEKTGDPRDQIVAANLGLNRTPTFGQNPETGGGIFQIKRMGYDDAEFLFFGWNRDIRRNTAQLIEVRKGSNSSMQIAVVRRMIQIIRENSDDDFLWISDRLGREITLSARPRDNAGLEDFLMQEFFGDTPRR